MRSSTPSAAAGSRSLRGDPREATLLAHLKRTFPNVATHLAKWTMRYHPMCRSEAAGRRGQEHHDGRPRRLLRRQAGHRGDDDVDIHNPTEVEWAVATRFQADRDLLVVSESQGSKLDPSTRDGVGSKMGLDATKPLSAGEMVFNRIRVPGEETVDVERLLAEPPVGRAGATW
jgi:2,5-furandicarboxylate decarboxylase 1